VFDALPIGVCLTDEMGYYRFMNDAYCAIYEYVREEMIGQHYSVIMPPDQIALAKKHYARLLKGDMGIPTERKRQRKDGTVIYIEAANSLVNLEDGRKMVITTTREITEHKMVLREQATRDSLTGLYNRRFFNETIEREFARARRENYQVSVMIMDIDLFKEINDSYGHVFGDEALRVLSTLINVNVRSGDIAYRYGGDEFVIVMPGAEIEIAKGRAEVICQAFTASSIHENGRDVSATLSVGIALYPEHGESGIDILRHADLALYQAKHDGRNRVCVWKGE